MSPQEDRFFTMQDLIEFYGNRHKAFDALYRAAILNDCDPSTPWRWEDVIGDLYSPQRGVVWANERLIAAVRDLTDAIKAKR